ncbi:MAG: DNA-binding response regulator [candidate division NC10 bacterium RIFCSPLOWO2_02_FULL_66_22]|nr:MAG: DNA-binding response regulator [candidate division NC10 bacterium RIFCSPLOWO2_02_FULL_66_22]
MEPIKVLLVDDHALFRKGVASALALQRDIEVVGEASNGQEALTKARELMPDVILMDISMPGMDGLEATRRIKAEVPHVRIIILTVAEEDKSLFEAIKSGAHGYLLKTIEPRPLFETLRGVFRGEAPISRVTASKILGEFARQGQRATPEEASPVGRLSPRELEILELLTKGATNKEIAATLGISNHTVKNHLQNIMEKLHIQNRVQAVAYALQAGLGRKPLAET